MLYLINKWLFRIETDPDEYYSDFIIGIFDILHDDENKYIDSYFIHSPFCYGIAFSDGAIYPEEKSSNINIIDKNKLFCKKNDIIQMILNQNELKLKYKINDYHVATIKIHNSSYKAAIYFFCNQNKLKLLSL